MISGIQCLQLVRVELHPVLQVPLSDVSIARCEYRQTVGCVVRRHGETELCVVSVLVELNT